MSDINKKQDQIIDEFSLFEDWMSKYEYIIDLGKKLEPMPAELKTPETLVTGCQSQAWITAEVKDGKIYYKADGDAVISKGLLYLLLSIVNGEKPEDVAQADFYFIEKIGLDQNLSPSRSNGLSSMIQRIKDLAEQLKNK